MSTTSSGDAGDYSYDMAHEDVLPRKDVTPAATQGQAARDQAPVVAPPDTAGDLSYDLAHEVPGVDA